jgi:hypothetical protein
MRIFLKASIPRRVGCVALVGCGTLGISMIAKAEEGWQV